MDVGSKIKYLLKKNKITQAELAKRINVSPVMMHKYIKRESIDAQVLYNISKEFNVSIGFFFDEAGDSNKPMRAARTFQCLMCNEKDKLITAQNLIIKLLSQQLDAKNSIHDPVPIHDYAL